MRNIKIVNSLLSKKTKIFNKIYTRARAHTHTHTHTHIVCFILIDTVSRLENKALKKMFYIKVVKFYI